MFKGVQARELILCKNNIINLIHLGPRAFHEISGEIVQSVAFVINNKNVFDYKSKFIRLTDYKKAEIKEKEFFNLCNYYNNCCDNFLLLEDKTISYWA